MSYIKVLLLLAACAAPVLPPRASGHMQECVHIGSSLNLVELMKASNARRSAIVTVASESFYCPCGVRTFGGASETRALGGNIERRQMSGDTEQRQLIGNTEDRKIVGTVEERGIGGGFENRNIIGASENRNLGGNIEKRHFGGNISKIYCYVDDICRGFVVEGARPGIPVSIFESGKSTVLHSNCYQ